jgi:hypothetical protein
MVEKGWRGGAKALKHCNGLAAQTSSFIVATFFDLLSILQRTAAVPKKGASIENC